MTRTRIGTLNIVSARAPERIEKPQPNCRAKISMPKRPTTIEGRLESVSIAVFAMFVTGPTGAYCVRKMAPPREIGSEIRSVRIKR